MTWERQRAYDYDEGKAAGMQQKALEDARNFLKEGISSEIISRCTGLSLEEVKNLSEEPAPAEA